MSDMKCPFCQQELHHYEPLGLYMCKTCFVDCRLGQQDFGTKGLWQELIRTRNALDVAKKGLQELKNIIACPPDASYETCVSMYADGVLQEITIAEQKEG